MTDENGEAVECISAAGLQKLCLRLSMITHTSMEYYMELPYSELITIVTELQEEAEERERAAKAAEKRSRRGK